MDLLYKAFASNQTPWVVAAAFLGIAGCVWLRWWWNLVRFRKAVRMVRNSCGLDNLLIMSVEQRRQFFAERNPEISEDLAGKATRHSLADDTMTFLSRCQAVQFGAQSWLETVTPPSECLDLRRYLLLSGVNVSFYRSLPGYLVGAGLCVTFLGLAVVISHASGTLESENPSNSLRGLLDAASNKFWSSLAAVILSIIYGVLFRRVLHQMEREMARLASDLENCVRVVSLGELQYEALGRLRTSDEHLAEMANGISLLKTGIENNQSSNAESHRQLLDRLDGVTKALAEQIGQVTTSVQGGFSDMNKELGKVNEEAFAKIAKDMADMLNEGIRDHLGTIAERLEDVGERLESMPDTFDTLVERIQKVTVEIALQFEAAVAPLEAALASALLRTEGIGKEFAELPQALAPARAAAEGLAAAAASISGFATRMDQQMGSLVTRWEELAAIITSVDRGLGESVRAAANVFPEYAGRLKAFNSDWQVAMLTAVNGLRGTIEELDESHNHLHDDRVKWQEAATQLNDGFQGVNDAMNRLTTQLATSVPIGDERVLAPPEAPVLPAADEVTPDSQ